VTSAGNGNDGINGDGTCSAGDSKCGNDYCTPSGGVCCASAGHPELYCPMGATCNPDGTCCGM
jgi:hypothetical protein